MWLLKSCPINKSIIHVPIARVRPENIRKIISVRQLQVKSNERKPFDMNKNILVFSL
jgi:hypothetical protein